MQKTNGIRASAAATGSPRIALIFRLRLNKYGSLEQWIIRFCRDAGRRGHTVTLFSIPPALPEITAKLGDLGVILVPLEALDGNPFTAIRLLRKFDVVHLNFVTVREKLALIAYLAYPSKVMLVDHNSGTLRNLPSWLLPLRRCLGHLSALRVSAVACVSHYVKLRNEARLGADSRIRTIYNGVDVIRFKPEEKPPGRPLRIIVTAYLIPAKGIDVLLHAVASLPDSNWYLTIVGTGPREASLKAQAAQLKITGNVAFLGLRNDVDMLLKTADVYIHPARWAEAFGLAIAEAMASGLPVIASMVGGIPELVEDGVNGILVPPDRPEELAAAIGRLASDRELLLRFGRASRVRAVERFSLNQSVASHLRWCEELGGLNASGLVGAGLDHLDRPGA